MRTLLLASVMVVCCVVGCRNLTTPKMTVLNVNDLNTEHKKDKEALRAKYDGKEVIVMGGPSKTSIPITFISNFLVTNRSRSHYSQTSVRRAG